MTTETFTTQALALKALADGASTNEERTQIITAIHRLIRVGPASETLDVKTALFGLVDTLTASMGSGTK